MPDNLSPENRRKAMRAVKSKGTSCERVLWAMLAGMRMRGWRKNPADVPGKPDVVFDGEKTAIFVDGCFWHGCPLCNRGVPEANREYWLRKIERNRRRAEEAAEILRAAGWTVLRIWEHQMKRERSAVREKIRGLLRRSSSPQQPSGGPTGPAQALPGPAGVAGGKLEPPRGGL